MKRFFVALTLLLLLAATAHAQTSGKACQAGQLKPALDACLTLLQQLCGGLGSEMVQISRALWLRLRQQSAQLSEVEAGITPLIEDLQSTRDKLNSL